MSRSTDLPPDDTGPQQPDAPPAGAPMPDVPRHHILTFAIGERFRYEPGGPVFARIGKPNDPVRVARVDARPGTPAALADLQTYVIPVDDPSHSDSGIFDGLGLTGFDPASGEEGGGL